MRYLVTINNAEGDCVDVLYTGSDWGKGRRKSDEARESVEHRG